MGDLVELTTILGWALLAFVLSLIYGCSYAGNKKIAWILDLFVIGLGIAAFAIVQPMAFKYLEGAFPPEWEVRHWWSIAANLIGYLACTIVVMVAYIPLYAGVASPPATAEAH